MRPIDADAKLNHAICCSTCKHSDKKITEEPCMICSPWCDKWEDKEVNGEDNKV